MGRKHATSAKRRKTLVCWWLVKKQKHVCSKHSLGKIKAKTGLLIVNSKTTPNFSTNFFRNYSSWCGLTFRRVRPWSVAWLPTNRFQCSKISSTDRNPSAFSSVPSIKCAVSSCESSLSGRTQALASSRSILPSLFRSNFLWKSSRCRLTQAGGVWASWYWPRNSATVITLNDIHNILSCETDKTRRCTLLNSIY